MYTVLETKLTQRIEGLGMQTGHFILASIIVIYGFTLIAMKSVDPAIITPFITLAIGYYFGNSNTKKDNNNGQP